MRPAIELIGVEKRFGDASALRRVDLEFARAATTALIGRSGSGKSTLLRLIIGLLEPSAGEIRIDGRPLRREDLPSLRRRMGYVIQEGGLFPHLTARGNVLIATNRARRRGLDGRIDELCSLARFPPELLGRYPAELSGGQRQRVGLMRALLFDPEILLLDEPFAALDPLVRSELQHEFRDVFARLSPTVVLVTHDLSEAAFLAGRLVLIDDGRVVQSGTLEDLERAPAEPFVTQFLKAQRAAG